MSAGDISLAIASTLSVALGIGTHRADERPCDEQLQEEAC